jgi:hypothetical protein
MWPRFPEEVCICADIQTGTHTWHISAVQTVVPCCGVCRLDLDYTLAQYRPETFEVLAHTETVKKLVDNLNYPQVHIKPPAVYYALQHPPCMSLFAAAVVSLSYDVCLRASTIEGH